MQSDTDPLEDYEREQLEELNEKPIGDLSDAEVTAKVRLSVKRRYNDGWRLAFEFTGENGRRADCIGLNPYASRNYKIIGFEFKASRSDWLAELKEGSKADYFVRMCDEWYVVAGRKGIVKESELPGGWGLLEMKPNSEQLWKERDSDLTDYQNGHEPGREFFMRFFKKIDAPNSAGYTEQDLREARRRGYEEGKGEGSDISDYRVKRMVENGEKWEELRDMGLPVHRLSEENMQRLQSAYYLLESMDSERFSSLAGGVDSFENHFRDRVERILSEVEHVKGNLEELRGGFVEPVDGETEGN